MSNVQNIKMPPLFELVYQLQNNKSLINNNKLLTLIPKGFI